MARIRYVVLAMVVAGAIFGVLTVQRARAADEQMPQAGQQAPSFTLPSQDGTPVSLSQYKGKWVMLYFYPKDMTSGRHTISSRTCRNSRKKTP